MKSINQIDFSEKKAFVRVDFNVPFDDAGRISDNSRIVAALPTIKHILSSGGSCILASHLGRPKGKTKDLSLSKLVPELEKLLSTKVLFSDDCIGEKTESQCSRLKPGEVILLENLRFYKEETNADESFAKKLSNLAEIYVNDAYGTTHREHASTSTMAKFFDLKSPGILLENEIASLKKLMDNPSGPVTAIIGGAKVSSKISVIANMLDVVDNLIIGGGMAYTFIKNNGGAIGDSIFEKDKLNDCSKIISLAEQKNVNVFLPEDVVASNEFSNEGLKKAVNIYNIPKGWQGLDIGPLTISKFEKIVTESKTILWNGPMGVFEMPSFEQGTLAIAKSVAKATSNGAFSLIGGGDSVAAIKKFNLQDEVSFISTGGGAMLESLEGKILPGIKVLN
jgi:phosphoglycerate kinase